MARSVHTGRAAPAAACPSRPLGGPFYDTALDLRAATAGETVLLEDLAAY